MPAYLKPLGVNAYAVNIIGLSLKAHSFDYTLDDGFFKQYGTELLTGGTFQSTVVLNKHETFIEADFSIQGEANLICDRSLEPFGFPIKLRKQIVFKYGEQADEGDDEVIVIPREQSSLDLGQLMYELIGLQIPMKKLHPKFRNEEEDGENEGKIVYQSGGDTTNESETIDPRWEILKKLNKK